MNRTTPRRRARAPIPFVVAALVAGGIMVAQETTAIAEGAAPPGPALLNAPPAVAPQLENTGVWHAEPTQICMSSAYRAGEFLYQGCPWDDQGGGVEYSWPENTMLHDYTYPTDPAYRANAADLVELRAKPLPDATAFRVTYNTMTDPGLVGTTIAIGNSATPRAVPHGANTVMPAQLFVTVHGSEADVVDAASGAKVADAPVSVDVERRQVEVRVPHSAFDPGRQTVRLGAATGLWDKTGDHYLVPRVTADATHPGGAPVGVAHPSAFFDSAFRYDEPLDNAWRDRLQLAAIGKGDLSPFFADVDFGKLAGGTRDDMNDKRGGVPTHGYIQRIFASHFESAQGRRLPGDPGQPPTGTSTQQGGLQIGGKTVSGQFGWVCRDGCVPDLAGRLQRYIIYVPDQPAPATGYTSMTWVPGYALTPGDHVRGGKDLYHSVGDRPDAPTAVIAVDARGADNWAYGQMGASVFESIADAAAHYKLDPARRVMAGFSSGAYSANKLALQFPDAFSKAFICDGLDEAPSFPGVNGVADTLPVDTVTQHERGSKLTPLLPSRRNQPVMEWAGMNDDFIPYPITRERANAYAAGGFYDYEFVSWAGASAEHMVQCNSGTWDVLTRWLGDGSGPGTPSRVTYVRDPLMDDPASGLVGNKAYWLSGIETRSTDGALGTIDVTSRGSGRADATAPAGKVSVGATSGTTAPVNPYVREYRHLPAQPHTAAADELDITAKNIRSVTIDPAQAEVDCSAKLNVTSDGPVRVTLLGCPGTQAARSASDAGTTARTDTGGELPPVPQPPLSGVVPPLPLPPTMQEPLLPFGPVELPLL
ncbi:hypothetical protein HFP15_29360 [Amycolatopsis sp. K13G38]|uniref:Peptidase n=1 Tax=Amycolatopsis acididurans TaxID=2724524 RepID=A0ABX1JBB7_9PSEU|nr:hypothetical protein [Amycolatopsis acididurans]NKQ56984.1 hypothetical protein [Amycolatopsis acididurans]